VGTRRIKYYSKSEGQKQTQPVKNKKSLENLMYHFIAKIEKARNNQQKRLADRNWMLVLIGINTAFRAEDLLQLRVKDVMNGYVCIKENKTGKVQNFKMRKEFYQDISSYIERHELTSTDYLFKSRRSDGEVRCITRQQADRILAQAKKDLRFKFNFSLHSLRKTFGYHYYLDGGKLLTLQKMYNHESPDVTLDYIMWNTTDAEDSRAAIYLGAVHK